MLRIINGNVYDPQHGVKGENKEITIQEGQIVSNSAESGSAESTEVIDAQGCVVFPGGVEIHSHIAGPKVNGARIMCPEDHYAHHVSRTATRRSGSGLTVPSTFLTGYRYSQLGYTTAFEPAVPALVARHAHEELADTPLLDTGIYTLMGNNYMLMKVLADPDAMGRSERLNALVSWLLRSSKGYAVKVVNPGGVESWKWSQGNVGLDTPICPFGMTPRAIVTGLVTAIEDLKLPHPLHLHANHLGEPGNVATTLATMQSLEGHQVHFTHLQFHAYGQTAQGGLCSAAPQLVDYVNEHPEVTFDVGQLVFGPVTTMTADSPMQYHLHQMTGHKWASTDVEMETGSGIVPLLYKPGSLANAIMWCIGLELLLLTKNPWQVTLTTDHPNAGPFTAYPQIIKLLMNRGFRREVYASLHPKVKEYTHLGELDREYSLEEIAVITRSGPAKTLGLRHKGHLGAGADGDVAVYRQQSDWERMFAQAAYVIKGGKVVVREGEVIASEQGNRFYVEPETYGGLPADLAEDFKHDYSIALRNFAVEDDYLEHPEVIPCR